MRTTTVWMVIGLVMVALLSQGCMRAATEGMEAVRGGQGSYFQEKPLSATPKDHAALAGYQRIEVGEVKNQAGAFMPSDFPALLTAKFSEHLAKSHLPKAASGKTIRFNVTLIYYEKANMTDNVFGPMEEAVASVELVDKDSARVLATGAVVGRSTQSVGLGPAYKADGMARGLLKWASDYYPKPPKE
jgi:hypothetical protein